MDIIVSQLLIGISGGERYYVCGPNKKMLVLEKYSEVQILALFGRGYVLVRRRGSSVFGGMPSSIKPQLVGEVPMRILIVRAF